MNLCGSSVKKYMTRQRLFPEDILVVHDDLELALGKAKLKLEGSAAGHNGVRSLINTLGCKSFKRLRIGIGRPSGSDVSDFVLSTFTRVEMDIVESISFPLCTELIFKSFSLK
jgi:PTH1 family peptidyl-tRNA hydrolase